MLSSANRNDCRISVSLSKDELEKIRTYAQEIGLTVGRYLVLLATGKINEGRFFQVKAPTEGKNNLSRRSNVDYR